MTKKQLMTRAKKWLKDYVLCSNCDKKEDCINAGSFCEEVVLAAYVAGGEEVREGDRQ
jgi:hypothetical protein